jgi:DNA modification methylase
MELSTKSVSIVSSTEALITFDGGATQVIKGTITIAPVNNTQNTALNICATGEPRIGNITLPGAEKITPKMNASTLSAGPDIRRRFFYTAKASKADKSAGDLKNTHPTVKSTQLMRYLIRLITPPGGVVLDPFGGSGSTGVAAGEEGMDCIMIEMQPEYVEIAKKRLGLTEGAADATV